MTHWSSSSSSSSSRRGRRWLGRRLSGVTTRSCVGFSSSSSIVPPRILLLLPLLMFLFVLLLLLSAAAVAGTLPPLLLLLLLCTGLPSTIAGFKQHPLYCLERHLGGWGGAGWVGGRSCVYVIVVAPSNLASLVVHLLLPLLLLLGRALRGYSPLRAVCGIPRSRITITPSP